MKSRIRKGVALGSVLAIGVAGLAFADGKSEQTSTVNATITPTKLDKNKYKTAVLDSGVTTENTSGPGQPHVNFPTQKVVLQYDDDAKVNVKAVKDCKKNLRQLTGDQAKAACPNSILGTGKAFAVVNTTEFKDIKVTAFRTGSKLYLHTYSQALDGALPNSTADVTGTLSKANGDFGTKATFPVERLLGGAAALTKFQVKLKKGVTARCHDGNKKFDVKGEFTYTDPNQPEGTVNSKDTAKNSSKCSVK